MSLHADYDPDNIFAKILRGDIPCAKIFENETVLSFMDAFPQSRGHCLVIPKAPSRNLLEIAPAHITPLFMAVQNIAKAAERALKPDGLIITQFNGAPAGQTVFHSHVHIIPRYHQAAMTDHNSGTMADMAQLLSLSELIKAEL